MGILKIFAIVALPISGMTYLAFSLGKQLPIACRRFGNYIGLSYVYFKTILKVLKPQDQMPYQVMQVARKASQQSQALRRELRNTMKRAKQDFHKKHEETLKNFQAKMPQQTTKQLFNISPKQSNGQKLQPSQQSGSSTMYHLQIARQQILQKRKTKKQSRRFFEEL